MMIILKLALFGAQLFAIYGVSKVLMPRLPTDNTPFNYLGRFLAGAAIIVCAMNLLLQVVSGQIAAWLVFVLSLAVTLSSFLLQKNRRSTLHVQGVMVLLLGFVAVLLVRSAGFFNAGVLAPMEGTGSHDDFWYMFVADWLMSHPITASMSQDVSYPVSYAANVNIGLLPRVGSETLIVFVSTVTGLGIPAAYAVTSLLGSILLFSATALGLLPGRLSQSQLIIALSVIAVAPVQMFIFNNMNLATGFGLAFLGGYFYTMFAALETNSKRGVIAPSIYLAALLATYPELLAVAVPATVFVFIQHSIQKKRIAWGVAGFQISIGLASILIAPFAVFYAYKALLASGGAAAGGGASVAYPFFHQLTFTNFAFAITTYDPLLFDSKRALLASVTILIVLLAASLRSWRVNWGLFAGTMFVFGHFYFKDYGYGSMKAVEFVSLPLTAVFATGVAKCVINEGVTSLYLNALRKLHATLKPIKNVTLLKGMGPLRYAVFLMLGSVAIYVWSYAAYMEVKRSLIFSAQKRLSSELIKLGEAVGKLSHEDVILVSSNLGDHAFAQSRWIAYQLRSVKTIFTPPLQQGGYIYDLDKSYYKEKNHVTHLLKKKPDGSYALIDTRKEPGFALEEGFYGVEPWGVWMSDQGRLMVVGQCAALLRFDIVNRLGSTDKRVDLSLTGGPIAKKVVVDSAATVSVEYPLNRSLSFQEIILKSGVSTVSPRDLGLSVDSRQLSYGLSGIEIRVDEDCLRKRLVK